MRSTARSLPCVSKILEKRIRQYEEELRQAGIEDPRQLSAATVSKYARARTILTRVALFIMLAPVALAGAIIHYPAYTLAGLLATKLSQSYEDVLSTFKITGALLLFPLTWLALSAATYFLAGWMGRARRARVRAARGLRRLKDARGARPLRSGHARRALLHTRAQLLSTTSGRAPRHPPRNPRARLRGRTRGRAQRILKDIARVIFDRARRRAGMRRRPPLREPCGASLSPFDRWPLQKCRRAR